MKTMGRNGNEKRALEIPVLAVRDAVHFPALTNTLHVMREPSLRAVRKSQNGDRLVLVLSQKDMAVEEPSAADLCGVGCLSEILQSIALPDGGQRVILRGISRAEATKIGMSDGCFWATAQETPVRNGEISPEAESLMRACSDSFGQLLQLNKAIPPEAFASVANQTSPGGLADAIAHHLAARPEIKQAVLEEFEPVARLRLVLETLKREEQVLSFSARIHEQVEKELGDTQREYYLREQLRVIQDELARRENRLGDNEELAKSLERCGLPIEALDRVMAEFRRLERMPSGSPEALVSRSYLEYVASLPWGKTTEDANDAKAAERLLNERHYGLGTVKNRILESLAVRQLRSGAGGGALCFVGPPGVGKTSFAESIAEALGRKIARVALGGVRDEAEIRGHRRTYVGAMPGRIVAAIRQCGTMNPVLVLDELDKMGSDAQGDPLSALLEVLDPAQNDHFVDHYLDLPLDLSQVLFVATANWLGALPPALYDRLEIVEFSSYTEEERVEIAKKHLWPKALADHGLTSGQVALTDDALATLATDYEREPGVRGLARDLANICRKAARNVVQGNANPWKVDSSVLNEILGPPRYSQRLSAEGIGVASAMVVSAVGGAVIPVEVSLLEPRGTSFEPVLTGNLGEVMRESATAAISAVRGLDLARKLTQDVHIHLPLGGVPKDGPSAGLPISLALIGSLLGKPMTPGLAATGEITLRGRILPVGGVRDKLLAAKRDGYTHALIPEGNAGDLKDLPKNFPLKVTTVSNLDEAIQIAFGASKA